jgi:hypothetical protein
MGMATFLPLWEAIGNAVNIRWVKSQRLASSVQLNEELKPYYDWWLEQGDLKANVHAREQAALRRLSNAPAGHNISLGAS